MGMGHEQPWTGRAYIMPGRLLFVGRAGTTAHHAHQLVTTFTDPLVLRDAANTFFSDVVVCQVWIGHKQRLDSRS
jgi:hypothetical protein